MNLLVRDYQKNISQVHDGNLNQGELEEKIQQMSKQLESLYHIRQIYLVSSFSNEFPNQLLTTNTRMINLYSSVKRDLESKLEKLMTFHTYSGTIFDEISSLQHIIHQGIELTKTSWDASTGRFKIPSQESLGWVQSIHEKWQVRSETHKEQFILYLQMQFGFDEKTARMIYRIKEGIDDKFPQLSSKDKDYLFMRILGAFSYEGFEWDGTAGDLGRYFTKKEYLKGCNEEIIVAMNLEEIFYELGFSEEEYRLLRYTIRIQHDMSGTQFGDADNLSDNYSIFKATAEETLGYPMTDDEFKKLWNTNLARFSKKADFSHQSITTATHLYDNYLRLANLAGLDHAYMNELSGWRGDVTFDADVRPRMGNDDYHADLDSVNIIKIMEDKKINYIEASSQYYNDIESGKYSRAEKFKENVGMDYIKSTIFLSLIPFINEIDDLSIDEGGEKEKLQNEKKMEYLKKASPITYNFIRSLEENRNDYKEYVLASEEG